LLKSILKNLVYDGKDINYHALEHNTILYD
jgi:hypothetical protein